LSIRDLKAAPGEKQIGFLKIGIALFGKFRPVRKEMPFSVQQSSFQALLPSPFTGDAYGAHSTAGEND
jgi:hypothetical protein